MFLHRISRISLRRGTIPRAVIPRYRQITKRTSTSITHQPLPGQQQNRNVNDQHDRHRHLHPRRDARLPDNTDGSSGKGEHDHQNRHLWERLLAEDFRAAAHDAFAQVPRIIDRAFPVQQHFAVVFIQMHARRPPLRVEPRSAEQSPSSVAKNNPHRTTIAEARLNSGFTGWFCRDRPQQIHMPPSSDTCYPPPMQHWTQQLAGRFIVFDGPDGSGKSTQFSRFAEYCRLQGRAVCEVREPGGTPIGEQIRRILLDPANTEMALRCEMMLYMASRSQLVEQTIRPALGRGEVVLADRFISSTLAYQGTAGGLDENEILAVGQVAVGNHWPDLTVVFDVDEQTAARRLNPLLDRMEQKGAAFHRKVRAGYHDQVKRHPDRYVMIDATADAETVFADLLEAMQQWRPAPTPAAS